MCQFNYSEVFQLHTPTSLQKANVFPIQSNSYVHIFASKFRYQRYNVLNSKRRDLVRVLQIERIVFQWRSKLMCCVVDGLNRLAFKCTVTIINFDQKISIFQVAFATVENIGVAVVIITIVHFRGERKFSPTRHNTSCLRRKKNQAVNCSGEGLKAQTHQ